MKRWTLSTISPRQPRTCRMVWPKYAPEHAAPRLAKQAVVALAFGMHCEQGGEAGVGWRPEPLLPTRRLQPFQSALTFLHRRSGRRKALNKGTEVETMLVGINVDRKRVQQARDAALATYHGGGRRLAGSVGERRHTRGASRIGSRRSQGQQLHCCAAMPARVAQPAAVPKACHFVGEAPAAAKAGRVVSVKASRAVLQGRPSPSVPFRPSPHQQQSWLAQRDVFGQHDRRRRRGTHEAGPSIGATGPCADPVLAQGAAREGLDALAGCERKPVQRGVRDVTVDVGAARAKDIQGEAPRLHPRRDGGAPKPGAEQLARQQPGPLRPKRRPAQQGQRLKPDLAVQGHPVRPADVRWPRQRNVRRPPEAARYDVAQRGDRLDAVLGDLLQQGKDAGVRRGIAGRQPGLRILCKAEPQRLTGTRIKIRPERQA